MTTKSSFTPLRLLAVILFVILFVGLVYTFLHEAGHALIGLLFGQSLTEFDVSFWDLSAHVGLAGGDLTQTQLAIRAAAGGSLPLLAWALWMIFVPRKGNFVLETLKLVAFMGVVNTLLAWIILPFLFIAGNAPPDDVTNVLRYSQMPPLLLAFIALVLYAGGWALFLAKINGLLNQFLLFRDVDHEKLTAGTRTTMSVMTTVLALCVVFIVVLNASAAGNAVNKFSPPQGFAAVVQVDLSERAHSSETLTEFTLDEPDYAGVFVVIEGINTTYIDISVIGPNGYHSTVMHGEGYNSTQDGGLWEERLLPGTYQVVLTSHQSPGRVSVYLGIPERK